MTTAPATATATGAAPGFSVCVYCGSRAGGLPVFERAARTLGSAIAGRGWQLVYGGGHAGLMGCVADAALAEGGRVVGVIPQALTERELGHRGVTELHVVRSMHERKQLMAERSDAFVALPGGLGTLEELFEVWTWRQLGFHRKPLGLLNVEGYYDSLLGFLAHTVEQGFVAPAQQAMLRVATTPAELLDAVAAAARPAAGANDGDYRLT